MAGARIFQEIWVADFLWVVGPKSPCVGLFDPGGS